MEEQTNEQVRTLLAEKQALAGAALEGDQKATKRIDEIDEEIRDLTRQSELSELAAREEQRLAKEARQTEERERIDAARKKYREYGEEWKKQAAKAQKQVDELRHTLDGLVDMDQDQREAGFEAGERLSYITVDLVLSNWFAYHLREYLSGIPDYRYAAPLEDLAPLPPSIDPPSPEEQAEREAATAQSRAEAEAEQRALDQLANAEVAAYEIISPAITAIPPENLRAEGVGKEIHFRVAEAVRRAGPDLPDNVVDKVVADAMRYGGFGDYVAADEDAEVVEGGHDEHDEHDEAFAAFSTTEQGRA